MTADREGMAHGKDLCAPACCKAGAAFSAGVEDRADGTLGELLNFMTAFDLCFDVASTPKQREIYSSLYPKLVRLRNEIAAALESWAVPKTSGHVTEGFLSTMSLVDLNKKAPKP